MKLILDFIIFLTLFVCFSDQLVRKVIKVTDGDVINILALGNEIFILRLSGIDAPEIDQAFNNRSKHALADFLHRK